MPHLFVWQVFLQDSWRCCYLLPSTGITLLRWYYEVVRLPGCLLQLLASFCLLSHTSPFFEGYPGSPEFISVPCNISPRSQTPSGSCSLACYGCKSAACSYMNSFGLRHDGYFGALSLHLRCGSMPPASQLHAVRCLPECGIWCRTGG